MRRQNDHHSIFVHRLSRISIRSKICPPINSPHRIERNIQLLNAYCFVMGLSFLSPVYVLYLKENLLGSTTSVSWILATQAITIFVLEVSTRH